jgi:hypothetical protein
MRISKLLAAAAAGLALAAAVMVPAMAGTSHPSHAARPAGKHGNLHSTLTPKVARPGTRMTLRVSGAEKHTGYTCIFALVKGSSHGEDLANFTSATSSKKGRFHCSLTFKPFKATVAGKVRHCPLTKADRKAGVKCGFAAADPSHPKRSNAFQPFTAKK